MAISTEGGDVITSDNQETIVIEDIVVTGEDNEAIVNEVVTETTEVVTDDAEVIATITSAETSAVRVLEVENPCTISIEEYTTRPEATEVVEEVVQPLPIVDTYYTLCRNLGVPA